MKYRQATLLSTESITTAGTKTIDINLKDAISRLLVVLEIVNTTGIPLNHPLAAIKSISITDGSEVIASMTGYAAQAMAFYDTGKMPHNELAYTDESYLRCVVPLNFGRYLYDDQLALDPMKYRNLQLHIEHNYALGATSPSAATLRVLADLFDEKVPSAVGYLLNKEIISFAPAVDIAKPIELPLDNTIRKLLVINTNNSEEPDILFDSVKVDEEDGKRIVVDCKTMDLIRASSLKYGQFQENISGKFISTDALVIYTTQCKDIQLGLLVETTLLVPYYSWSGGRARTLTSTADTNWAGIVTGRCPHGGVEIPFGKQDDPADWWDVASKGKAKLTLTGGNINDTEIGTPTGLTDVVVQSLQRY